MTSTFSRRPAVRTRRCEACGAPFAKVLTPADPDAHACPCRFCGHRSDHVRTSSRFATIHLRLALDGMPPANLHHLRHALRSVGDARTLDRLQSAVAPISPPLASWIGMHDEQNVADADATLCTVVDVLHLLSATSRKHTTAAQVHDTVVNVIDGRLDRLPLPDASPCFCRRGTRYGDCHGRGAS